MISRRLAATAVLAVALSACTSPTTTTTSTSAPTSPASPTATQSPIPSGPIVFVPGEFSIDFAEVRSDLSWDGGEGTLHVTNDSDTPVGAPALYAVTRQSTTVDATIQDAAKVDPGEDATFTVVFPDTLNPDDAGLLILSFGGESWGAMAPVVVE
jgi:hypothetical protein